MTLTTFLFIMLTINVICVSVTDMTDWQRSVKRAITYILTKGRLSTSDWDCHLIDCSLCQTFWLSLIWLITYIILGGAFHPLIISLPVISALLTTKMKEGLFLMIDLIGAVIRLLYKLIGYIK